jgi:site-specific recombinase XerD
MQSFIDPNLLERLRVGPLAPYLDLYLKRIEQGGFLPSSVPMQMYAIARFSKWLDSKRIDLRQVDEPIVERFLKRDLNVVHSAESAPLRRFLAMLRDIGVAAAKPPEPSDAQPSCANAYRRYLVQERGLADTTVPHYVAFAEQFLSDRFGPADLNLSELTASDVARFMRERAHQLSPGRSKLMVTALRSFLRYLRHQGEITVDLAGCVPPVAAWSLSTVPKFLPAGTVQRVLDHCERGTAEGKRNYAVLLLLARLGLRACEIVALNLDDIDWDNGRITVRCKGGRWAQLPLPSDVGEAVATYLRSGRPHCVCRRVFLRHRAPIAGFAHSITVSTIVRRALIRAGIDSVRKGAHLFRHTLATDLLRNGASLDEIGELLRHRSPNTTALYAKVDLTALRSLALSWPGEVR